MRATKPLTAETTCPRCGEPVTVVLHGKASNLRQTRGGPVLTLRTYASTPHRCADLEKVAKS